MRFGVPAARLGIGYRWRGIKKLVDTVGAPNAREIFLTARRFDAATALRMGFVNRLVARGELEAAVRAECELIAANAPMTMAAVKLAIDEILRSSPHLDAAKMEAATRGVFASEDFIEGRRAFMAKRPPKFLGR
jgi:enoyl-CoA hydratase/carnithine racemase